MAYEYKIKVENVVNIVNKSNGTSTYVKPGQINNQSSKASVDQQISNVTDKKTNIGDAISAGLLIESSKKLMGSIQNETIQNFVMTIGKITKYTTVGLRALDGDVVAIVSLCVDVLSETIKALQSSALENAAEMNSVDDARLSAGVLELNGVQVNRNWWSGRYTYSRNGGGE